MSADASRGRLATGVVAAATVSALILTAAPAFAEGADGASSFGIGRAVTAPEEHGTFSVPVWSDDPADPVVSVSAVIRDGSTPVGDPIDLVKAGTAGADAETWTLPRDGVLTLDSDGGRMPHLGRYAIDISASDSAGMTLIRPNAGTLDFTLRPRLRPQTFSPATVDLLHRSVTVSGTLVGVRPGTGGEVPLAGRDVAVDEEPWGGWGRGVPTTLHATTDEDGHYATTVAVSDEDSFSARFTETSDQVGGSASSFGLPNYGLTALTVTGTADRTRVLPGQTFTVSGVVRQGLSAPSTAPVAAGVPVAVDLYCPDTEWSGTRTVTDATGHYTATLTADPECDGTWSAVGHSPFVGRQTWASGRVAFPDHSTVAVASSAIAADGTVTVTGKLLRTYHRAQVFPGQNTFLWYSRDGKTNWIRLKGANTDGYGAFKLVTYGYVDGYYQVRHTVTDQLAPSNGPIVRLTRIDTRVAGLKASATRVRPNTVITVSGTLQQYTSGAWRPYAWQHVYLYFLPKGKTAWTYKGAGTTAANGSVGFRPRVAGDGKWLIQYFGDARHFDSGATPVYVEML